MISGNFILWKKIKNMTRNTEHSRTVEFTRQDMDKTVIIEKALMVEQQSSKHYTKLFGKNIGNRMMKFKNTQRCCRIHY